MRVLLIAEISADLPRHRHLPRVRPVLHAWLTSALFVARATLADRQERLFDQCSRL